MATPTAANVSSPAQPSKALHITLWVVQVLVGLAFIMAGGLKVLTPVEELAKNMAWVNAVPAALVPFIGVSEFAGGLGLILPSATRIKPGLTPLAAAGLVVVMVLAASLHIYLSEPQAVPPNVVLGGLSAFVAWGRFKKAPIAPRS